MRPRFRPRTTLLYCCTTPLEVPKKRTKSDCGFFFPPAGLEGIESPPNLTFKFVRLPPNRTGGGVFFGKGKGVKGEEGIGKTGRGDIII